MCELAHSEDAAQATKGGKGFLPDSPYLRSFDIFDKRKRVKIVLLFQLQNYLMGESEILIQVILFVLRIRDEPTSEEIRE